MIAQLVEIAKIQSTEASNKIEGIYTLIRVNEEVLKYSHIEYKRKAAREEISQLEELLRLRREYDQSNDN